MRLESNTESEKVIKVTVPIAQKIANEFNLKVIDFNGKAAILIPDSITRRSIEEETEGYETFYDKNTGHVYCSAPPVPLPMNVEKTEQGEAIVIYPCTPAYGIVHKRDVLELHRSIRFFLNEIVNDAFHFSENEEMFQIEHPIDFDELAK